MKSFFHETTYEAVNYDPIKTKELLEQYKVLVLRGYDKEEDPQEFFDKFSEKIGFIYGMDEDLMTGAATGKRWIDITYDPAIKDKYRAAPVAQPLHTDYSYIDVQRNLQFFYCASQAKKGGATTFIDADELVELLEMAGETDLLERLKSIDVTFEKGGRTRTQPILTMQDDGWHFNWNYYCLDKGASDEQRKVVEDFHEFLQVRVVPSGLVFECLLTKHDVVFFHDEYILHGRNAYFATEKGQRSLIKGTIVLDSVFKYNQHIPEIAEQTAKV